MSTFRYALAATVAAATLARVDVARAEDTNIGYVNMARAIMEVEEGKRARSALEKTFKVKQADLTKRENELKALKDSLEKETNKDDPKVRARILEFEKKYKALQEVFVGESQALQKAQAEEVAKIQTKMKKIIAEIGKSGKYSIILEVQENRLLFAKPHLDLTNEVIRKYNTRHK